MDLMNLDTTTRAEAGAELEIKHPKTGKGIGFFLTIKGADSRAYKAALKDVMKRATPETTSNEVKEAVLVACVTGWRAEELVDGKMCACPVLLDGKEIQFNEPNLKKVLDRMPTIRDQALAFQDARANFLPSASES